MDEFYTINQTAIILKVHPLTVRRYIKEQKLKAFKAGGSVRISVPDLKQFMQTFVPKQKSSDLPLADQEKVGESIKSFSFSDPFFRLKGKGLSLSQMELKK